MIFKSHVITSFLTIELLTWNSFATCLSSASLSISSTSCLHTDAMFCPGHFSYCVILTFFLQVQYNPDFSNIFLLYQLLCFPPCLLTLITIHAWSSKFILKVLFYGFILPDCLVPSNLSQANFHSLWLEYLPCSKMYYTTNFFCLFFAALSFLSTQKIHFAKCIFCFHKTQLIPCDF